MWTCAMLSFEMHSRKNIAVLAQAVLESYSQRDARAGKLAVAGLRFHQALGTCRLKIWLLGNSEQTTSPTVTNCIRSLSKFADVVNSAESMKC